MYMKKRNKMLVGCLALLLVLSVGYALFSEQVTINGTAKAKGNFSVKLECDTTDIIGSSTGSCSVSNNKVSTTSGLNKPTDSVYFYINITNDGTIPMKLKSISSPNNVTHDFVTAGDCYYFDENYFLTAYYWSAVGVCDSEHDSSEFILQPGETTQIGIAHEWYDKLTQGPYISTEQPKIPENGVTFNYDIIINFEQVTN